MGDSSYKLNAKKTEKRQSQKNHLFCPLSKKAMATKVLGGYSTLLFLSTPPLPLRLDSA